MFGFGFRGKPPNPGWGLGCVCLGTSFGFAPPLLVGVRGVGVRAWARFSAAPRHSWVGCRGVCLFVCALCLYPANPGWGVRCGCVCLGSGFGCAPPLLAGVLGSVCVCVRPPPVPRRFRLGCAVWVCVLRLLFRLRPAIPGPGIGVCVCLWACSACTPPIVAGVRGVGVCAWAPVLAAPRHSWLGCCGVCQCAPSACTPPFLAGVFGCVYVCVRAPPVPRQSWLGCVVWVVWAWARVWTVPRNSWLRCSGLCVFVYALCLYPANSG